MNYTGVNRKVLVVVLGFYVPPTSKVIQRRDLGLKSHRKDWVLPVMSTETVLRKMVVDQAIKVNDT